MNTPNKYTGTPYASTPKSNDGGGMYPSQSADFISFHMGGQAYPPSANKWRNERGARGANNRNNNFFNRDASQQQHQQPQQNVPYFYQDRTPQSRQHHNNNTNSNRRFNYQKNHTPHGYNKDTADITDYIHSSMLEDPWQSLVERHETIEACDLKLHEAQQEKEQEASDEEAAMDATLP